MNTNTPTTPVPTGVFVSTMSVIKNGQTLARLEDYMREVTKAVQDTQRAGSVTLNISIEPNGLGVGEQPLYKITATPSRKVPEHPEKGQSFFADEEGNLTRRNPQQAEMKLSVVSGGQADLPVASKTQPSAQ